MATKKQNRSVFFIDEGDVETGVKIVLGAGGGQLQAPHSFMGGGNNQQLPAPPPAPSITPPVERRARREVRNIFRKFNASSSISQMGKLFNKVYHINGEKIQLSSIVLFIRNRLQETKKVGKKTDQKLIFFFL